MYRVYIGLGSNLGDRLRYLNAALGELRAFARIVSVSSVYETAPVDMRSDRLFYNAAVALDTALDPPALLGRLKDIERALGRSPSTHHQDREIDIDILLYEGMTYSGPVLESPHPRMAHRRFVLEPLREIAPLVLHPVAGKTIEQLWRECPGQDRVERTGHHLTH